MHKTVKQLQNPTLFRLRNTIHGRLLIECKLQHIMSLGTVGHFEILSAFAHV